VTLRNIAETSVRASDITRRTLPPLKKREPQVPKFCYIALRYHSKQGLFTQSLRPTMRYPLNGPTSGQKTLLRENLHSKRRVLRKDQSNRKKDIPRFEASTPKLQLPTPVGPSSHRLGLGSKVQLHRPIERSNRYIGANMVALLSGLDGKDLPRRSSS